MDISVGVYRTKCGVGEVSVTRELSARVQVPWTERKFFLAIIFVVEVFEEQK